MGQLAKEISQDHGTTRPPPACLGVLGRHGAYDMEHQPKLQNNQAANGVPWTSAKTRVAMSAQAHLIVIVVIRRWILCGFFFGILIGGCCCLPGAKHAHPLSHLGAKKVLDLGLEALVIACNLGANTLSDHNEHATIHQIVEPTLVNLVRANTFIVDTNPP